MAGDALDTVLGPLDSIFGSPSKPKPPEAPLAPPNPQDAKTAAAMENAAAEQRRAQGRAATILTKTPSGPQGSGLTAKRTLLGS